MKRPTNRRLALLGAAVVVLGVAGGGAALASGGDDDATVRVGYTVTKKIGNAVVRNRMKRRFRALVRDIFPDHARPGADHVLIGRAGGIERDFLALASELKRALAKVAA